MNAYFKVHAYANLYKVGKDGQSYAPEDITVTMVRERKPTKLMEWLWQQGCCVEEAYRGVYYIKDAGFFVSQIIVSKELDDKNHIWLKSLTDGLDRQQARQLLNKSRELLDRPEAEYVDSVLQIVSKANPETFDRVKKEDADMYSALVDLMRPEIDAAVSEAVTAVASEKTVEAIENAINKLNMSTEEACAFMDITVEEYRAYKQLIDKA